ncbi:MAG: hypothetical protein M3464_12175 [Chloroflexota bacterium]|nr:hypothetical protein [Chloroflexota bacterium]
MHRLLAVVTVLLVVSAGWLNAAVAQDGTPAADPTGGAGLTATGVRYVLPYTSDALNPELTVIGNVSGSCLHESIASPGRPDAWACLPEDGGGLLDPCFESPFAFPDEPGELACLASPFTQDVTLLTATEPLPRVKDDDGAKSSADEPLPWAFELADGEQCTLATGATNAFAGMRINYFCSGGGAILGEPDRSRPVWTVIYVREGAYMTDLIDVTVVWH